MSLLILFSPYSAPEPPRVPLVITLARRPGAGSPTKIVFGGSDDAVISAAQDIPGFSSVVLLLAPAGIAAGQAIPEFTSAGAIEAVIGCMSAQVVPAFASVVSTRAVISAAPAQLIPSFVGGATATVAVSIAPGQVIPAFIQFAEFATTVKRRFALVQTIPAFTQSATARDAHGFRRTERTYDVPPQTRIAPISAQSRTCAFGPQKRTYQE